MSLILLSTRLDSAYHQPAQSPRLLFPLFLFASTFFFLLTLHTPVQAETKNETVGSENIFQEETFQTSSGQVTLKAFTSSQPSSLNPFVLTLEFRIPEDLHPEANDIPNVYGDFYLESLPDVLENADDTTKRFVRAWNAYPGKRGKITLPPIPITFNQKDGKHELTAIVNSVTFNIPEVDQVNSNISAIVADHSPIPTFPTVLCLCLVTICLIIALMFLYFRSKAQNVETLRKEVDQEDAFIKAIRKLNELKASKIYLENQEEFYTEIAAIVREYLSVRFSLKAEESTTSEILSIIDSYHIYPIPNFPTEITPSPEVDPERLTKIRKNAAIETLQSTEIRKKLESALQFVDLVKFANRPTTFNDASAIFKQVEDFVELAESTFNKRFVENQASISPEPQEPNSEKQ